MNQTNRRLLIKAADLLVTQAATLATLEESAKGSGTVNLQAGLAYTARFKRIQPHLFEMEALAKARSSENEIFKALKEILAEIVPPGG
jgi:hypothetical protein